MSSFIHSVEGHFEGQRRPRFQVGSNPITCGHGASPSGRPRPLPVRSRCFRWRAADGHPHSISDPPLNACSRCAFGGGRKQLSPGPFAMPSTTRRAPSSQISGRIRPIDLVRWCIVGCSPTPSTPLHASADAMGFRRYTAPVRSAIDEPPVERPRSAWEHARCLSVGVGDVGCSCTTTPRLRTATRTARAAR
jgi:hypothetical protein